MQLTFQTPIEYLKGIGPQRAALLNKQLNIFTFADLLQHYPYRYEDRTKFYDIKDVNSRGVSLSYKFQFEQAQLNVKQLLKFQSALCPFQ